MRNHFDEKTWQTTYKEGDVYLKSDGEVYTIALDTECRMCELVWGFFHGDIPTGYNVGHIDGNKRNNRLDNLKLVRVRA